MSELSPLRGPPSTSVDSPPVTSSDILSGYNFREVAPKILSPLSWSIIGWGMESGFRYIARRLGGPSCGPGATFVGYLGFRPFHNMSSIERLVPRLPLVRRDDVWEFILGGPAPIEGSWQPVARLTKARSISAELRLIESNGRSFATAAGRVAAVEHRIVRRWDRNSLQLGSTFTDAVTAGRDCWALHMRTTGVAIAVAARLRWLAEHHTDDRSALALVKACAQRARESTVASAQSGRHTDELDRLANYEVADRSSRFAPFANAQLVTQTYQRPRRSATTSDPPFLRGTPIGRLTERLGRLLSTALAEREHSKELALRSLHAVRLLLDDGWLGMDPSDAALLGADELLRLENGQLCELVETRGNELDGVAGSTFPVDLERRLAGVRALRRRSGPDFVSTGAGLSPGYAEGQVVTKCTHGEGEVLYGRRVDANYVLAMMPEAVVTTLGSVLSHVAIVCRELGIPLVAGITLDAAQVGRGVVAVDGWSGEVVGV